MELLLRHGNPHYITASWGKGKGGCVWWSRSSSKAVIDLDTGQIIEYLRHDRNRPATPVKVDPDSYRDEIDHRIEAIYRDGQ